MNQGLLLISPMVLVRLLPVEQFGRYREFLLYSSVLMTLATFSVNSSLLHFVPHRPDQRRRFMNQALIMTLFSSVTVLSAVAALNSVTGGALVGDYMLPIALYVAVFVNFDFWEHLWLAQRRVQAVFAYTTGRLIARMTVVITAAALSGDVDVIIWSLVCLETLRLLFSATAWLRSRDGDPPPLPGSWREQLQFCVPIGAASVLLTLNKSMGSLFVAKLTGPVGLAQYAIGTYVHPILAVLRNSLSDVLLPEMSAQKRAAQADPLELWRRMTIAAAILLVCAAVVLGRFAETLVVTLFSAQYKAAVPIFQVYMLVLLRETVDFAVPLRAMNRTAPIMQSTLVSIVLNITLLAILLPALGVVGAAVAYVISRFVEALYLGIQTARAYEIAPRELVRWGDMGKVAAAAVLASTTLLGSFWTDALGFIGVFAGGAAFSVVYVTLLLVFQVPEAKQMFQRAKNLSHALSTRT